MVGTQPMLATVVTINRSPGPALELHVMFHLARMLEIFTANELVQFCAVTASVSLTSYFFAVESTGREYPRILPQSNT
jgi:hypothetical protein